MADSPHNAEDPPTFNVDTSKSSEDNIDAFWSALRSLNPSFTEQLESHLASMHPLPAVGQGRNAVRKRINDDIATWLDEEYSAE